MNANAVRLLVVAVFLAVFALVADAATFDATITWSSASTNESGFKIYRKLGATGTYAVVGQTAANVTTYTDLGLVENATYFYQIGAFNSINELKGPEASGTTGSPVNSPPGAPTIIFIYKP